MKADRLLSALLLLQAHGRLSGRELAERLEVSERTIHRDMESLSIAGVPIYAARGAQGGWQLEKGWRTQVPGMDPAELNALLMVQPRFLADPKLAAAADRAFQKLLASLSGPMRARAETIRERLYVDATGWRPSGEDLSLLSEVQDAVARDSKISFHYTRADGEAGPRTVDPLGLVSKGANWYLVAKTPRGLRTYRVSRMKSLTVLALPCERPARFDLANYWKKSTAELERQRVRYEAILMIEAKAARRILEWWTSSPVNEGPPAPDGWLKLRIQFESEEQARFIALGFGPAAQVVAPDTLRDRVLADARAVAHSPCESPLHRAGS
ncbi:MAG TPA: YafY family protein [Acidobacteriaceae bacterium]|nr:YafY family protein [Acidobacteriaceae bacterium]